MIIVLRKRWLFLGLLITLLGVTVYGINTVKNEVLTVVSSQSSSKNIVLDPGHGGEDPGAVSDYSGLKEKDINLKIALNLKSLLEKSKHKVLMTRNDDTLKYDANTSNVVQKRKQDLLRRKSIMDSQNIDMVVSIHLNKFPQPQYHGAQVFYPPNIPEAQKLAQNIQKALREIDSGNNREALLKKEKIIILKDCRNITVIVECGFLSNQDEEKRLGDENYQKKLSECIYKGIQAYLKNN